MRQRGAHEERGRHMADADYQLMLKATWYYYMENYTQQQISQLLGVSRAKVIRLLDEARATGVIRFLFREDDRARMEVERELIGHFGLEDAFVVPTPAHTADLTQSIAQAASVYIADHLRADGFLNIGYGDMTGLILDNLASSRRSDINVASLTGGVSYYLPIGDRIVSSSLDKLQSMRNVIGAAGGSVKVPAMHAALTHGYFNVLVTDEQTAKELLEYSTKS